MWMVAVNITVDNRGQNVLFDGSVPLSPSVDSVWTTTPLRPSSRLCAVEESPLPGDGTTRGSNPPHTLTTSLPTSPHTSPRAGRLTHPRKWDLSTLPTTPMTTTTYLSILDLSSTFTMTTVDTSRTV